MSDRFVWGQPAKEEPAKEKAAQFIFKEPSYVETVENRIYFYGEVDQTQALQLNKSIRNLGNSLQYSAHIQERPVAPIYLHINSYGGSLLAGLAMMDVIANCPVPVTTVVDGCCASAATLMTVVGRRRWIYGSSFMLIHQLSALGWGKYRELQDFNKNITRFMDTIKHVYGVHTKLASEQLDGILDHDLWFTANECLDYGMVDTILEPGNDKAEISTEASR